MRISSSLSLSLSLLLYGEPACCTCEYSWVAAAAAAAARLMVVKWWWCSYSTCSCADCTCCLLLCAAAGAFFCLLLAQIINITFVLTSHSTSGTHCTLACALGLRVRTIIIPMARAWLALLLLSEIRAIRRVYFTLQY